MKIIEIERLGRGRCLISTEEGFSFPLYEKDRIRKGIVEGMDIGEAEAEALREEAFLRMRKYLFYLMDRREYSRRELIRKLRTAGYPGEWITDVMEDLPYQSDTRLAELIVHEYYGKKDIRWIRHKGFQRGIDSFLMDEAVRHYREEFCDEETDF